MYKIAYIMPYFGKLPKSFLAWLTTCRMNSTIDWILFTDDKTRYDFPNNVKVIYMTFDEMIAKIRGNFEFEVVIDRPWKICEFRPAFGEIFYNELQGYDFWGHCDMDLIWGNIRKFITDDILNKFEKIGFQGHSTLYKNNRTVNARYKTIAPGLVNYKEAFTSPNGMCFDEVGICAIYDYLKVPYYKETNFAHLDMFSVSFFLGHLPQNEDYKNKYQVFYWRDGNLYRLYLHDRTIHTEEYMYLHFFCRPMQYIATDYSQHCRFIVYPDKLDNYYGNEITYQYIKKKGRCSALHFYWRVFYERRKKLTVKKIVKALKTKQENSRKRLNSKNAVRAEISSPEASGGKNDS